MDSILVVCYSHTGNSRRAAQLLCSHRGWPLGEIMDVSERNTWRCVLDSLLRRKPEIRYAGPDPADFRTVVLNSPVWMYRLAGPMRSFVIQHKLALHRVAIVSRAVRQALSIKAARTRSSRFPASSATAATPGLPVS